MSLGNWDQLAVDHNGQPCSDMITFDREGTEWTLEVYKNWLYVHIKGVKYPFEIRAGIVHIFPYHILAESFDENGRFFLAVSRRFLGQADFQAMYCIAVYGYDGDEFVGVRESDKAAYIKWAADMVKAEKWSERLLPLPKF